MLAEDDVVSQEAGGRLVVRYHTVDGALREPTDGKAGPRMTVPDHGSDGRKKDERENPTDDSAGPRMTEGRKTKPDTYHLLDKLFLSVFQVR